MRTRRTIILPVCAIIPTLFGGCATTPHNNFEKTWIELDSRRALKEVVEARSPEHSSWAYMGSDQDHHYFVRQPTRLFIGAYKHFKVLKSAYDGIPSAEERPITWNSGQYSHAFSQAKLSGGFSHSVELGLVDDVLIPRSEQISAEQASTSNGG